MERPHDNQACVFSLNEFFSKSVDEREVYLCVGHGRRKLKQSLSKFRFWFRMLIYYALADPIMFSNIGKVSSGIDVVVKCLTVNVRRFND